MGRLLPADEGASVPDDALGDAIADAVDGAITFAHLHVYADRAADGHPDPYAEPCPACAFLVSDLHSDDDPAAATDY